VEIDVFKLENMKWHETYEKSTMARFSELQMKARGIFKNEKCLTMWNENVSDTD